MHLTVQPFAVERILAHQLRLQMIYQRLRVKVPATARCTEESMAFRPVVGADRQQTKLTLAGKFSVC